MQINWNNISAPAVRSSNTSSASPLKNLGEVLQKSATRKLLERRQDFEEQQIESAKQKEIDDRQRVLERDRFAYDTSKNILTSRKRLDEVLAKNETYQNIKNEDLRKAYADKFYSKFEGQNVRKYGKAYGEFVDALLSRGDFTKEEAAKFAETHINSAFPTSTKEGRAEQAKLIDMLAGVGGSGKAGSGKRGLVGTDANKGFTELSASKNLGNKALPWIHNYFNPTLDAGQYREAYDYLQGYSSSAREFAISNFVDTDGKPLIDFNSSAGKAQLKKAARYAESLNSKGGGSRYYLDPEKRYELHSKNILSGYKAGVPEEQLLNALNGIIAENSKALSQGPQLPEYLKGSSRGAVAVPYVRPPTAIATDLPEDTPTTPSNNLSDASEVTYNPPGIVASLKSLAEVIDNNREGVSNFFNSSLLGDQQSTSKTDKPNLSDALTIAETGNLEDPYIRTQVSDAPGGSTAYGPMQLTTTTAQDYVSRFPNFFSPKEKAFAERLIAQGKKFAKYGNNPQLEGYDSKYDYGGKGDLTSKEDQKMYTKFTNKVLDLMAKDLTKKLGRKPSDLEIAQAWRGVSPEEDPRYFNKLTQILGQQYELR